MEGPAQYLKELFRYWKSQHGSTALEDVDLELATKFRKDSSHFMHVRKALQVCLEAWGMLLEERRTFLKTESFAGHLQAGDCLLLMEVFEGLTGTNSSNAITKPKERSLENYDKDESDECLAELRRQNVKVTTSSINTYRHKKRSLDSCDGDAPDERPAKLRRQDVSNKRSRDKCDEDGSDERPAKLQRQDVRNKRSLDKCDEDGSDERPVKLRRQDVEATRTSSINTYQGKYFPQRQDVKATISSINTYKDKKLPRRQNPSLPFPSTRSSTARFELYKGFKLPTSKTPEREGIEMDLDEPDATSASPTKPIHGAQKRRLDLEPDSSNPAKRVRVDETYGHYHGLTVPYFPGIRVHSPTNSERFGGRSKSAVEKRANASSSKPAKRSKVRRCKGFQVPSPAFVDDLSSDVAMTGVDCFEDYKGFRLQIAHPKFSDQVQGKPKMRGSDREVDLGGLGWGATGSTLRSGLDGGNALGIYYPADLEAPDNFSQTVDASSHDHLFALESEEDEKLL